MERDIPGQSEAHWKIPIQSATVRGIASTLSNRGVPPRARRTRSKITMTTPPRRSAIATGRGPKRCRSMA